GSGTAQRLPADESVRWPRSCSRCRMLGRKEGLVAKPSAWHTSRNTSHVPSPADDNQYRRRLWRSTKAPSIDGSGAASTPSGGSSGEGACVVAGVGGGSGSSGGSSGLLAAGAAANLAAGGFSLGMAAAAGCRAPFSCPAG